MIGKILRDIRSFNEVTLTELSRDFEISQGYLSEIERELKEPTLEVIQKYSVRFDIPVSAIMFFNEYHNEPKAIAKFRKMIGKGTSNFFDFLLKEKGE